MLWDAKKNVYDNAVRFGIISDGRLLKKWGGFVRALARNDCETEKTAMNDLADDAMQRNEPIIVRMDDGSSFPFTVNQVDRHSMFGVDDTGNERKIDYFDVASVAKPRPPSDDEEN